MVDLRHYCHRESERQRVTRREREREREGGRDSRMVIRKAKLKESAVREGEEWRDWREKD